MATIRVDDELKEAIENVPFGKSMADKIRFLVVSAGLTYRNPHVARKLKEFGEVVDEEKTRLMGMRRVIDERLKELEHLYNNAREEYKRLLDMYELNEVSNNGDNVEFVKVLSVAKEKGLIGGDEAERLKNLIEEIIELARWFGGSKGGE